MGDLEHIGGPLMEILERMGLAKDLVDRTPAEQREYTNAIREATWHKACAAGRCRYADADIREENPPPVDSATTCGGYHGVRRIENVNGEDLPVWRWRKCVRHADWAARRYAYVRETRTKAKNDAATPTPTSLTKR